MEVEQPTQKKILRVFCPHCKREMDRVRKENHTGISEEWHCPGDCPYIYTDKWFNTFTQYKSMVVREKEKSN